MEAEVIYTNLAETNFDDVQHGGDLGLPPHSLQLITGDCDAGLPLEKIARLVGTGKRVLELGYTSHEFTRMLQKQDCQVASVEADPARIAPLVHPGVMSIEDNLDQWD